MDKITTMAHQVVATVETQINNNSILNRSDLYFTDWAEGCEKIL